jgi:hypothetical protein
VFGFIINQHNLLSKLLAAFSDFFVSMGLPPKFAWFQEKPAKSGPRSVRLKQPERAVEDHANAIVQDNQQARDRAAGYQTLATNENSKLFLAGAALII